MVCTYEFHMERMTEARKEFQMHNLESIVSTDRRDIEAQGFPEEHHDKADAVFLDLPGPWKVCLINQRNPRINLSTCYQEERSLLLPQDAFRSSITTLLVLLLTPSNCSALCSESILPDDAVAQGRILISTLSFSGYMSK